MDVSAAFDSIYHLKFQSFIKEYIQCPILQYLFLSMLLVQNLCISLGNKSSKSMQISQGILQDSKLSPKWFISMLDWALKQGSEELQGFKYIFADDILLLGLITKREDNMRVIQTRLSSIGLQISIEKSYQSKHKIFGLVMPSMIVAPMLPYNSRKICKKQINVSGRLS